MGDRADQRPHHPIKEVNVLSLRPLRRRGAVALAGLLAVAVLAGGAGIAAAGSGSPKAGEPADSPATGKPAADKPDKPVDGVPPGVLVATRQALDGLVSDGTIDQGKADAVQTRVASGTVDTSEVIASGVLDESQMERVNDVLRAIKLSYTGP
jgi:hypothetical protein